MRATPDEMKAAHLAAATLPLATACEACGRGQHEIANGAPGVVWHHHSYAPEHRTDVIPLCRGCHRRVHSGRIQEPRTGRVWPGRLGLVDEDFDAAARAYAGKVTGPIHRSHQARRDQVLHSRAVDLGLLVGVGRGKGCWFWPVALTAAA